MRLWTLISGSLMFCVLWFLGWETWAVVKARGNVETVFAQFDTASPQWAELDPKWQATLLAVVDPKFLTHRGVDLFTPGAGRETITEVLSRRLFFERFTPGFAEIEQSLVALLAVDPRVTKARQATAFIALADFDGATGFADAARRFYAKPFSDLTYWEFTTLVAAIADPATMRPGLAANRQRADRILALIRGECAPLGRDDIWLEAC